jgi:hypothetical protein
MASKSKPPTTAASTDADARARVNWNRAVREAYTVDADVPEDADDAPPPFLSEEEVDRQLREAGLDVEEQNAAADKTYEKMVAKLDALHAPASEAGGGVAWTAPVVKLPPPRNRRVVWLAYVIAAAAATGGAAYVAAHRTEEPRPPTPEPPKPAPPPVPSATPAPAPEPTPLPPPADKARSDKGPSDKAPSRDTKGPR